MDLRVSELNVRTYVRVGGVPGVYFFSLDAANSAAVAIARTMFHLPYFSAAMKVEGPTDGSITRVTATRAPALPRSLSDDIVPSVSQGPVAGTLEHFLTERYCLFTVDASFRSYRLDIHHPLWPLQRAEALISVNTMAHAAGIHLPARAAAAFLEASRHGGVVTPKGKGKVEGKGKGKRRRRSNRPLPSIFCLLPPTISLIVASASHCR